MIHRRLAAFILPVAACVAIPANAAPANKASDPAAAARVQSHVEFLADDLLEGRDTGSRGHELAALYVVSQFRALGLKPAGENGSWYQQVPFRRATSVGGPGKITINVNGKPRVLAENEGRVSPSLTEKSRNVSAGLVFVGYGLEDPAMRINDYAGLDVRGKIVVLFRGSPRGLPTDIASHLGVQKAAIARRHGAIGIIEISAKPPSKSDAAAPLGRRANRPVINWVDKQGRLGGETGTPIARVSVSNAVAASLFDGSRLSLKQVRDAAAKSSPRGFALRPTLSFQSQSEWTDFTSPEVVAMLPGADPKLKDEYVVMMGHLDHLGIKADAKPGEDRIYNGALDTAAGVATLIEAARLFVDSKQAPRRSVLFLINTGEEKGLLGADFFASHPTVPIGKIISGVDLDMPVPLYEFTDVVAFGADHSTLVKSVAAAGKQMGITVSPDPMPQESIFTRSDHYSFVEKGVPAILLFTGYANGGKPKWDDFFEKRYHSVSDDLNQKILWEQAARYAEFNYRLTRILTDSDSRPLWYQGNYFGNLFAPAAPRAPVTRAAP
jgi:hypothetical protein